MSSKSRDNWENGYDDKMVTYVEDLRNPSDVEQMWHYKLIHDHIVNYLPDIKKPKVIEVGCGWARNAFQIGQEVYRYAIQQGEIDTYQFADPFKSLSTQYINSYLSSKRF